MIVILLACITGYGEEYFCAFLSVSIHEAFHVYCGKIFDLKVYRIIFLPTGLTAEIDETNANLKQKIILYISGPLSNIILFMLIFSFLKIFYSDINDIHIRHIQISRFLTSFYQINIYLAIFNMIPVFPLDGGKILFEILARQKGLYITQKYVKIISFSFFCIIFYIGIIQSYLYYNFNILIISIYLAYLIKSTKWEAVFMNLKQLLFRRSRILKKGIYPARALVVLKSTSLGNTLKNMDFDGFHIVHVLDDDLKVISTFTEQDIIDGLIEYDNDITFEQFMKKKL